MKTPHLLTAQSLYVLFVVYSLYYYYSNYYSVFEAYYSKVGYTVLYHSIYNTLLINATVVLTIVN